MFTNGSGDLGTIPAWVISKDSKNGTWGNPAKYLALQGTDQEQSVAIQGKE